MDKFIFRTFKGKPKIQGLYKDCGNPVKQNKKPLKSVSRIAKQIP